MIRIGDFSKLSQVSIKTLRYYDEMGLFKPINVDRFTGYRYYSAGQLPRLNRILALRDLGLSLEQIAQVLDEGVSPEQLRGMLRLKRAELQQHIAGEQARLARVEARLNTIELEDTMPDYDVVIKQIEPQLVAGVRDTLSSYPEVGRLFEEVYGYLVRHGVNGPDLVGAAIWHDDEYKTSDIDGEAVVYLKQSIPESERVKVYELPATQWPVSFTRARIIGLIRHMRLSAGGLKPMVTGLPVLTAKSTCIVLNQYVRMMICT